MMTVDLTQVKTKSGKGVQDFQIPDGLLEKDPELVVLIMGSESMDDSERQYWFNLWLVMKDEQIEKLRDILTREKKKLAETEAKYAKKPKVSSEEIEKRNEEMKKKAQQEKLERERREAEHEAKEGNDEDILSELEGL